MLIYALSFLFDFVAQSSSVLTVVWHVLGGASPPGGLGVVFKDSFSALHCAH